MDMQIRKVLDEVIFNQSKNNWDWDMLVVHVLGLDHAGHTLRTNSHPDITSILHVSNAKLN